MTPDQTIRSATIADIAFLAKIQYESILPPCDSCFWEPVLADTGTPILQFIAAMLQAQASHWGNVADFLILELQGNPVAAAAGYQPGQDYRMLDLTKINTIATALHWSETTTLAFLDRYQQMFGDDPQPAYFAPSGDWLIEYVAVLPEFRGQGLVKVLLAAVLAKGRSLGCRFAGISIVNGNEIAAHAYERLRFQRYQTFHANYFDDEFPGMTKFRRRLSSSIALP
jgi:ribosomal protein S18 acetylase RimI-like enzyme